MPGRQNRRGAAGYLDAMTMQIEPSRTSPEVKKAVIPAGGLDTRFLPATKATPKEMLPVVDKPAIQYVVEEAVAAGCDDVLIVTGPRRWPIEDHFDSATHLETALAQAGDTEGLAVVRHSAHLADMHYVRQGEARGLGNAVLRAARHVGSQPFAVLLGSDLVDERDPILPAMLAVRARYGGSVVAVADGLRERRGTPSCAEFGRDLGDGTYEVTDLSEKLGGALPGDLCLLGRYVLDAAVFEVLRHTVAEPDGRLSLAAALRTLAHLPASKGGGLRAVVFSGRRYSLADRLSYLQSVVQLTCDRPDLGPAFREWLADFAAELGAESNA